LSWGGSYRAFLFCCEYKNTESALGSHQNEMPNAGVDGTPGSSSGSGR